jgi:leucyl aminopeptidase
VISRPDVRPADDADRAGTDRPAGALAVLVNVDGAVWPTTYPGLLPISARTAVDSFAASSSSTPGELRVLPLPAERPALVAFVGIGTGSAGEARSAGAALARISDCPRLTVALTGLDHRAKSAFVEGLLLGGYRFSAATSAADPGLLTVDVLDCDPADIARGRSLGAATAWARQLTNVRSSIKTPAWLADQAREQLSPLGVTVLERDETWLAENQFGGVLAVGGGSAAPPRLIQASWRPRKALPGQHIVLVGKGITFDTGGLNIKPIDSMASMHTDMGGGAAALAALGFIAELKVPIRVTVLVPTAENSVSGSAMRPGDVVRHYGGRTSEIGNTDAEGRIVLADALAYAVARLNPSVLIDLATLTGAMKVALGVRTGGLFATTDELAAQLIAAGEISGEQLWRMPLSTEYQAQLASDIADANNSPGNPGGITAALFLRAFVGDVPWAHLDIAGPARSPGPSDIFATGATGFGARLLAEWLLARAELQTTQPELAAVAR